MAITLRGAAMECGGWSPHLGNIATVFANEESCKQCAAGQLERFLTHTEVPLITGGEQRTPLAIQMHAHVRVFQRGCCGRERWQPEMLLKLQAVECCADAALCPICGLLTLHQQNDGVRP